MPALLFVHGTKIDETEPSHEMIVVDAPPDCSFSGNTLTSLVNSYMIWATSCEFRYAHVILVEVRLLSGINFGKGKG